MIIIDTNVWVSFFKGERKAAPLKEMIIDGEVMMHPYVFGELLLGGINQKAQEMLRQLAQADIVSPDLIFRFIIENKLKGKGIGWVDVGILASALHDKHLVYTFDENLVVVCREFNCHFN
ncbi:MAG TPA: PIN domain-containing protein [Spirochaetota bacterium]|nr:PIN domain-containing protein [Spirochaetota bacterium]HRZ27327.1 PIN domain-containing protein [Spirochaetota bacterium]